MVFRRLPLFKRVSAVAPIQLTERDRNIIRFVHRYRFLRSGQIAALLADDGQQLLRRLQLLYHHGYLERPRAQLDYYHQGGSRQIAYGIGNKGGALLKQEFGARFPKLKWGEKNRSVGRIFLEHALLITDVMVGIELACRRRGDIRMMLEDQLLQPGATGAKRLSFRWNVNLGKRVKLGVIPDRVFALECTDEGGKCDRAYFFLEADRGTMPVTRRTLSQTSFFRKLLAYEATWSQNIHQTRFGFHRFRVITVTTSLARVDSLVKACSKLKSGRGLFLFADTATLQNHGGILTVPWQTGTPGETATLLS